MSVGVIDADLLAMFDKKEDRRYQGCGKDHQGRIGGNTKEPKYTLPLVIGVIPFAVSLNNIAVMKKNDEITT